jgi:hypothetical protein
MPNFETIRTGYFLSRSTSPENLGWGIPTRKMPTRTGGEDERVEGAGRERHGAGGARDRDGDQAVRFVRVEISVDQRLVIDEQRLVVHLCVDRGAIKARRLQMGVRMGLGARQTVGRNTVKNR